MRATILLSLALLSCQPGPEGEPGPSGPPGPMGAMGAPGRDGAGALPERSGERIKVRRQVYVLADGAQYENPPRTVWDSKLDVPCRVVRAEDDQPRCLPAIGVAPTGYLDAGCTRAILAVARGVAAPKYMLAEAPGQPSRTRVYLRGGSIPAPATIYDGAPGACRPSSPMPGLDWYDAYGNALPPADFVAAEAKTLD